MSGVLGTIISPVASALGLFKTKKLPTPAVPLPTVTPRANSVVSDALSARRGSAANQRTGSGGVESSTGKKSLMGQ